MLRTVLTARAIDNNTASEQSWSPFDDSGNFVNDLWKIISGHYAAHPQTSPTEGRARWELAGAIARFYDERRWSPATSPAPASPATSPTAPPKPSAPIPIAPPKRSKSHHNNNCANKGCRSTNTPPLLWSRGEHNMRYEWSSRYNN